MHKLTKPHLKTLRQYLAQAEGNQLCDGDLTFSIFNRGDELESLKDRLTEEGLRAFPEAEQLQERPAGVPTITHDRMGAEIDLAALEVFDAGEFLLFVQPLDEKGKQAEQPYRPIEVILVKPRPE